MIRINLLPVRQIKQRIRTKNEVIAFITLFFILLAALGLFAYTLSNKVESLKKTQTKLVAEKKQYESIIKQIEKIKKDQALLESKLAVIKTLKANSQLPVRILDEIARMTPTNRMWLNSLSLAGGSVNLSGIALDNATIAQYMDQLTAAPYFASAELKNSSLTTVADQKLKSFSLTLAVKKTQAEIETEAQNEAAAKAKTAKKKK